MIGELARQRTARRARLVLSVVLGSAVLALVPGGLPATAGPSDPITISDASVAEGGTVVFTISRTGDTSAPTTGRYTTSASGNATGGSACTTVGTDFVEQTAMTTTFTIPANAPSTTVEVQTCGDDFAEPNEAFTVTIDSTSVVNGTCTGDDCTATGTILNNDGPPAVLSIGDATATEGDDATIDFTLSLDKAPGQDAVVHLSTVDGTATEATDFDAPTPDPVTFGPAETTKTVSVPVSDDGAAEATETFTLKVDSVTNISAPDTEATGTIHDDDSLPVLTVDNDVTDEGTEGTGDCADPSGVDKELDQCVVFEVTLSTAPGATVRVDYATVNGTATASQDFVPQSGQLTFPADGSVTRLFVRVPVKGDAVTEGDETFTLVLSDPQNASCTGTGADCTGVGSILEGAIPITVDNAAVTEASVTRTVEVDINLATPPGDAVDVDYHTVDGTAEAGDDYEPAPTPATVTFDQGEDTKTVDFDIYPDALDENAETFSVVADGIEGETICVATATAAQDCTGVVTINDDPADTPPTLSVNDPAAVVEGNADTTTITFTVSLSAASGKTVAVTATTANQTATGGAECGTGVDYVTKSEAKTFAAGETSKQFTVTVCGDELAEANETFLVNLSSASNATITDGQGTGTISNDDGPAPALSVNDVSSTEGNTGTKTFTFTVTLAQTSGKPVTVNYATSPGTASASVVTGGSCSGTIDYVSKTGSLTFTPGDTSEPITVTVCGDTRDENDETFTVTLSNPQNATLGDASGTGTITDDDAAPFVGVLDAEADESDGSLVFDVQLSAASGKTVTVNVTTENGTAVAPGDYTAKAQTLTFTPGQVSKTFTVIVKDDTVVEDDEEMAATLLDATNAVVDPDFETAAGFIFDDDEEPVEQGYALVDITGEVYPFGTADHFGSMAGQRLNAPMIGIALTTTGNGYWLVAEDGGIFAFGDARFYGSMGNARLNAPVLGMEPTPTGNGYWLFAADGGIFAFGDAKFRGSMGDQRLNQPVVGMAATTTGEGYWLVASDGGIFAFGDAPFRGSMGDKPLNDPVFDMASTADNGGYWLVGRDGGIFAFGNAEFHGSLGDVEVATVVGMDRTPQGQGYWIVDEDGFVYEFGDAEHLGDVGGELSVPIVGFGALYPRH